MNELEKILNINFPKDTRLSFATNSSHKVKKNTIFFGLPGTNNHGSKFCKDAIDLGAALAVHNDPKYKTFDKNIFYVEDLDKKIVSFLDALYDVDINSNNFFAFTGTNGKTTAAYLCHQLLTSMNYDSIYIGTLGIQYNNNDFNKSFSLKTTPDIFELYEIIQSLNFGLDSISICIEISSHALDQGRLKGVGWLNSTSILNITSDHMEYHKNIDRYKAAKFEIFKFQSSLKLIDDESYKYSDSYDFLKNVDYKLSVISKENIFSDIFYKIREISLKKTIFEIFINKSPNGYGKNGKKKFKFSCNIFPEFNIHNLVFAICSIGVDEFVENQTNDLNFLKLPKGRVEIIKNIPSNVIIDYAHNPRAVSHLLKGIKKYYDNLVVVMGCGGDRDKSKRAKMLSAAIKSSSKIFFTSDNSRSEDFELIFEDAIKNNDIENVVKIKDRKEAIIHASKRISKNDCLVILGKGHEQTQEEKDEIKFFSDHEVVNEIYK